MTSCAPLHLARLVLACCGLLGAAGCQSGFDPSHTVRASRPTSAASWKTRREEHVVMQRHDYSCGAASLATLLKYYFGEKDVTEQEILVEILGHLTEEEIENRQRAGLSLLDLRDGARRRGYTAEGLKLEPADLALLNGPVLVHLLRDDLPHFVILRGVRGDRAFLSDPSYGNLTLQADAFAKEWTGYVLCVDKEGSTPPAGNPLAIDANEATSAPRFGLPGAGNK